MSQLDASTSAVTDFEDLLPRRSQRSLLRRFSRHRLAAVGLGILLIFGFLATFAPVVSVYDPNFTNLDALRESPSLSHPLGTDAAGRDVWARMLSAGRVSLAVGLLAAAISMVIGTVLGIVSGYVGGWVDNLIQRFTEIIMMFPTLFALILLVAVVGSSVINVIVIIGALGWTGKTRLVRGQVLSLKEMEYVTAARAIGAGGTHLMIRHLLPGVIPYVVVATMLTISGAILSEATLSFLGLGVRIPTATWGNMINSAQSLNVLKNEPWLWLPPGIAISMTVLAVNFVGDGLRDALDPHSLLD